MPSLGPVDIEKQVSFPVETALSCIPGLEMARSLTLNGFSQVTAVLTDATSIYFARQPVIERLAQAANSLPAGVQPQLAPLTTGSAKSTCLASPMRTPTGAASRPWQGNPATPT